MQVVKEDYMPTERSVEKGQKITHFRLDRKRVIYVAFCDAGCFLFGGLVVAMGSQEDCWFLAF